MRIDICIYYIYIYTYTHTYIYIYTHVDIRVYVHVYLLVSVCIGEYTQKLLLEGRRQKIPFVPQVYAPYPSGINGHAWTCSHTNTYAHLSVYVHAIQGLGFRRLRV